MDPKELAIQNAIADLNSGVLGVSGQLLVGTVFRDRRCKAGGQVNNHTQ
jgi:hypothetical protein